MPAFGVTTGNYGGYKLCLTDGGAVANRCPRTRDAGCTRELYAARALAHYATRPGAHAYGSDFDPPMKVTTRIDADEVANALDKGSDEEGSKSEAVRRALVETYSDGQSERELKRKDESLRTLREVTGPSGWIEVNTAKSVLANRLNIPRSTVKTTVFEPLRQSGDIEVVTQMDRVSIKVND